MKNYFATSVLVDGYLYGFDNNKLCCQDFRTGKAKWRAGGFNRGSLIVADGKLIILRQTGWSPWPIPRRQAYHEISKFQFCDGTDLDRAHARRWAVFLRNEKELACYQLK